MRTWSIGDITVTSVIEVDGPAPGPFLFPEATPDAVDISDGALARRIVEEEQRRLSCPVRCQDSTTP